jgi:hypothetical protein
MNAAAIIQEAKEWTLSKGEALYCDHAGNVWVGRDGCQPSNACFLANHADTCNEDFDWHEVKSAIADYLDEDRKSKETWENESIWNQTARNQSEAHN